jgi:hypothetical protein
MVKKALKVVTCTSGETFISAFWVVASVFLLSFFGSVIYTFLKEAFYFMMP